MKKSATIKNTGHLYQVKCECRINPVLHHPGHTAYTDIPLFRNLLRNS